MEETIQAITPICVQCFFDGDIDFINERLLRSYQSFLNSTGYVFSNWQIGQAVLYLPFFMLGHFLALFYSALGYPIKADGYSAPYFIATAIASATYLFAGIMIMCRVLNKIVNERIAVIATVSLWMASPLLYYTFIRQRNGTYYRVFSCCFIYHGMALLPGIK